MKKTLLSLGAIATAGAPIAAVVSCGGTGGTITGALDKDGKVTVQNVTIALDGPDHSEKDKSFNQSAFEGINAYLGSGTAKIAKPSGDGTASFKQMYTNIAKGSTIVTPGFNHAKALADSFEEINGKNIILLDGSVDKPNVVSVQFKVEQAAFLAGYALADYAGTQIGFDALKNKDGKDATKVIVSTFGGMAFPTVTGFMAGLKDGIAYAKTQFKGDSNHPQIDNIVFQKLDKEFSGGFAIGGAGIQVKDAASKNVDVLLPVAGPQTNDVLVTANGYKGMVIGVDTDQSVLYSTPERFLFSITKGLKDATTRILTHLNDPSKETGMPELGGTLSGDLENNLVGVETPATSTSPEPAAFKTAYDAAFANATVKAEALKADTKY